MKRFLRYLFLGTLVVVITLIGIRLIRNLQMEAGTRALKEGDGVVAVEKFKTLAKFGDQSAQYLLGNIYAHGWGGVSKNDQDAIYWFRRAAMFATDGVDPAAPAELGVAKSYAEGINGVKIDAVESVKWLRLAVSGGSKEAKTLLANIEKK
jgi:TPR repeat protein